MEITFYKFMFVHRLSVSKDCFVRLRSHHGCRNTGRISRLPFEDP